MLLNETRGSYGMYSREGRMTAETFHLLRKKEEILSGNPTKLLVKGNFNPDADEYTKVNEIIKEIKIIEDDEIDIFAKNRKLIMSKERNKLNHKKKKIKEKLIASIKNKYEVINNHNNHVLPTCTRYNPKFNYIWKRCLTGPNWDISMKPSYNNAKSIKPQMPEFYLSHQELNIKGKNLIDLSKMTYRNKSNQSTKQKKIISDNKNIDLVDESDNINALTTTYTTENLQKTDDSIELVNKIKEKIKINKKKKYNKNNAPDFKNTISREQLERLSQSKNSLMNLSAPKYSIIKPKQIVLVTYDKMLERKEPKAKDLYEADLNFDPDKLIEKVNNHKKPITPNFQLMKSRPTDRSPLPSYMKVNTIIKKQIFDKQSTMLLTENSLKMNNFSEGKFANTKSCFWPKKSFNKIVNLNLISSKKFTESIGIKTDFPKKDMDNLIRKSMKFYDKNFEQLMNKRFETKFDNVTYKTINKSSIMVNKDLENIYYNN